MMNKIIITDSAQFEGVISALEDSYNNIKDIFSKENTNVEKINGTDIWTGATAEAMYEKYKLLTQNFGPIEYSLDLYIKFLKKTLEDYKRAEEEISKNIDDISESLDVIS